MKALTAVCALAFMACQAWQAGASRMEPLSKRHAHSEALRASPFTYCFAGPDGQLRTSSVLPSGTPWLSRAQFEDQIDENGWTFLRLEGRKSSNDTETAFAAGEPGLMSRCCPTSGRYARGRCVFATQCASLPAILREMQDFWKGR